MIAYCLTLNCRRASILLIVESRKIRRPSILNAMKICFTILSNKLNGLGLQGLWYLPILRRRKTLKNMNRNLVCSRKSFKKCKIHIMRYFFSKVAFKVVAKQYRRRISRNQLEIYELEQTNIKYLQQLLSKPSRVGAVVRCRVKQCWEGPKRFIFFSYLGHNSEDMQNRTINIGTLA